MDRHQPICRVSMSGFQPPKTKPDKELSNGINSLNPICRVCRVFLGKRESQGNEVFTLERATHTYPAHSIGLE